MQESGMFSVKLDTTQDVSSEDQVTIVLRYVDKSNVVKERLFALVDGDASTGECYVNILKKNLSEHNIDISVCVGDSTDGASNMQTVYKGFSIIPSAVAKFHLHTWCHALVLSWI